MTKEDVKKLLPVMNAFVDGKSVQYYDKNLKKWIDAFDPLFTEEIKYRIKPEPKYRPFENRDECYETMLYHKPFGWVIDILNSERFNINSIGESGVGGYTYKQAFKELNFIDGQPFGIKTE